MCSHLNIGPYHLSRTAIVGIDDFTYLHIIVQSEIERVGMIKELAMVRYGVVRTSGDTFSAVSRSFASNCLVQSMTGVRVNLT